MRKFVLVVALVLGSAAGGSVAMADQPAPAVVPNAGDSSLVGGEVLGVGQAVRSPNGRYTFVQQPDGNLVLYNPARRGIWSSNTARSAGAQAVMQPDGNFVVYDRASKPVFHTNTAHHPGARLDVQNDGNVVIYDGRTALWHTATTGR